MKKDFIENKRMPTINELHLEPRVARLETWAETLTKNVNELAQTMKEYSVDTNKKLDTLMVSVTQAQAPKKTDWSLFMSIAFFILALGSAVFWPLNKTSQDNKVALETMVNKFDTHQQLELHPVGKALLGRVENQMAEHVDLNNKTMADHQARDREEFVDMDKKLQTEYQLMNSKLETQVNALEARIQMEIKLRDEISKSRETAYETKQDLVNERIYARVVKLEELEKDRINKELDELRQWRQKASGLMK